MTHGSLFSGIGGFDLGFERAGMESLWQVENDGYAQKILERHFPNAARFYDVRRVGKNNLAPVDVISGGFPCQDISDAGKRAGITGKRSGLWSEYARIISELRPKYVVVENVAALLNRGMGRVLGDLAEIGYDAEWSTVSGCALGASHTRERVFIVAYPAKNRRRFICKQGSNGKGSQQISSGASRFGIDCTAWQEIPVPRFWSDAHGVPKELAQGWRAVGNAVIPQIAEWIGRRIMEIENQ